MKTKICTVTKLLSVAGLLVTLFLLTSLAQGNTFTPTFIIRIGGSGLNVGDENILGKYDIAIFSRRHYDDIGGNTWQALRAINPDIEIYLYQQIRASYSTVDGVGISYVNNIARWYNSRGHSMGSLYGDNPELVLLDENGDFIINPNYPDEILNDVGSTKYQDYWNEATIHDLVIQHLMM